MRNLWRQPITFNRWIAFIAAAAMCMSGGMVYVFATISVPLKVHMKYSQYEINMIGTMNLASSVVGFLPAFVHDYMGPRFSAIMASILMCLGYMLIYMAAAQWFASTYWMVGCFYLIFDMGEGACYIAAMATSIKNFNPKHRGKISGLLSCVYGIAPAVFAGLFKFVFHYDLISFLLFLSMFAGATPLVCSVFLNVVPKDFNKKNIVKEEQDEVDTICTLNNETKTFENEEEEKLLWQKKSVETTEISNESVTPWRMLQSIDFYLFFLLNFSAAGVALAILNNIGSVVISYGGNDDIIPNILIINSVGSCIGRILFGYISDRLSLYAIRPTFLNISVVSIGFVSYMLAFADIFAIYFGIFFCGIAYGGLASVRIAYLADRFGPKYLGINNIIFNLSTLLGSYILSTVLAGTLYQANIKGSGKICRGRDCYQSTFLIMAILCLITFLSTLYLMHRNQAIYAEIRKRATAGKK